MVSVDFTAVEFGSVYSYWIRIRIIILDQDPHILTGSGPPIFTGSGFFTLDPGSGSLTLSGMQFFRVLPLVFPPFPVYGCGWLNTDYPTHSRDARNMKFVICKLSAQSALFDLLIFQTGWLSVCIKSIVARYSIALLSYLKVTLQPSLDVYLKR